MTSVVCSVLSSLCTARAGFWRKRPGSGKEPHVQHKITPWSIHGNPPPLLYPRPGDSRAFLLLWSHKTLGLLTPNRLFLMNVFSQGKDVSLPAKWVRFSRFVASGSSLRPFWWSWRRISSSSCSTGDTQDNFSLGGRREGAASTEIRVGKRMHCWSWGMADQDMIPRDRFWSVCPPQVFPSCLNKSPLVQLILFQPPSSCPDSARGM